MSEALSSGNPLLRRYPQQARHTLEQTRGCFTHPADLPPGMLLLCRTAPRTDGWSLGSPAGYRPPRQRVRAQASIPTAPGFKHT